MFKLNGEGVLTVTLPEGKTSLELLAEGQVEIRALVETGATFGRDIKIIGRITTGLALMLGHELGNVCRSVSLFDPKEGRYDLVIKH